MVTIEFVDTSVLLNILDVPGKNQDRAEVLDVLRRKRSSGVEFVLPITAVIETGNHIAQLASGHERRVCAGRFSELLEMVAETKAPWRLHELGWNGDFLRSLVQGAGSGQGLVQHAVSQVGCGDLCVMAERDLYQSGVSKGVQAGIWTLDQGLAAWA